MIRSRRRAPAPWHTSLILLVSAGCSSSNASTSTAGVPDAGAPNAPAEAGAAVEDSGALPQKYMPAGYTQVPYLSATPVRKFAKAEQVVDSARDYVAVLDTAVGPIVLDLFEKDAPVTTNSFVFLALNHFHEETLFHRVIEGFMAQGGDPNTVAGKPATWGTGGCGYTFGLELKANLSFDGAGVLGQARAASPDSNGSQFFITLVARKDLDQKYTVWGKVTEGLDLLPKIARGEPPAAPTKITEVRVGVK